MGKGAVLSALETCKAVFVSSVLSALEWLRDFVAEKVARFAGIFFSDENKLLLHQSTIEPFEEAWALNLALMRDISRSGPRPLSSKEQLQVDLCASQYLRKVAPPDVRTMSHLRRDFRGEFQTSGLPVKGDGYHRFSVGHHIELASKLNTDYPLGNKSPLILTDTADFTDLLSLRFEVMEGRLDESSAGAILGTHFASGDVQKALTAPLPKPLLIDLTSHLGAEIGKDRLSKQVFQGEFNLFKEQLNKEIERVVDGVIAENPALKKHRSKMIDFMRQNIIAICRVDTEEGITGMKVLPLFADITGSKVLEVYPSLGDFMVSTGLTMSPISLRRTVTQGLGARQDIHYAVGARSGKPLVSAPLYPTVDSFRNSAFYRRMALTFGVPTSEGLTGIAPEALELRQKGLGLQERGPIQFFGRATMELLGGLLDRITPERWEEVLSHPIHSQIVQLSLHKIREFLSRAELCLDDYNQFAQMIELVHAEVSTLLEIIRPYQPEEFSPIYKEAMRPSIPEALSPHLTTGLCKTSVNVCAGISRVIHEINPDPTCVYSRGFYFEQAGLVGTDHRFDALMNDENAPPVDVYFGQFNSNIEIETQFSHYERRDIAADVRRLIDQGKAAPHLTVAIDCTIDSYESENIRALLAEFEPEIRDGRLNFIFFRSGQKFDMLGMDGYYGSPLSIVNNGAEYWRFFHSLMEREAHRTDELSTQWFCLAHQYGRQALSAYRETIFANTRSILAQIPPALQPRRDDPNQGIRVSTVDDRMIPCFIDIKVLGKGHKIRSTLLLARFFQKMISKGIKVQCRATFGLYHPNGLIIFVNQVAGSSTIRLHPGLDPKEVEAFREYFEELAAEFPAAEALI